MLTLVTVNGQVVCVFHLNVSHLDEMRHILKNYVDRRVTIFYHASQLEKTLLLNILEYHLSTILQTETTLFATLKFSS